MPTDPTHGLKGAIDVLAAASPAPAAAAPDAVQADMFAEAPVLGRLVCRDDQGVKQPLPKRAGPGRPPGARNRTTRQMIDMITGRYGHPLMRLAELASTPIEVLADTFGCSLLEAAEFSRKCQNDLAPYVAQRLPQLHQIEQVTAGALIIQLGQTAPGGEASEHGLNMRIVENQRLGRAGDAKSDDDSRTEGENA